MHFLENPVHSIQKSNPRVRVQVRSYFDVARHSSEKWRNGSFKETKSANAGAKEIQDSTQSSRAQQEDEKRSEIERKIQK